MAKCKRCGRYACHGVCPVHQVSRRNTVLKKRIEKLEEEIRKALYILPRLGVPLNSVPYHNLVMDLQQLVDPPKVSEPKQIMDTNAR